MLAAHRAGGRTNVIAFAHAWDRFAFRDGRARRARRATERELRVLRVYLETSLLADEAPVSDLAAVRRAHLELREARQARERSPAPASDPKQAPRAGDPDRSQELAGRDGWSWSRLVRRYDDYERVLARLEVEAERAGSGVA
jgi:hypothetical protein